MALSEGQLIAEKYRIERLLGEGGMGAVYVATNTVLRREVALKVMTERFAAVPQAVERFHREAIAASRVTHPSIVQVFDAGAHEGKPWIAMELLDGESLGDRLERGPMSLEETVQMATGALSALAEVHGEGIVHRDLKPDNVFLAKVRGGSHVVPKVLDFGIAKDTSAEKLNKLTATGAVVGTAYYLSPEQAKGLPDIDARADVYAMGVLLFECLSGRMPYEAETITQLIAKMFTESPPPLSAVAPQVPKAIAEVVDTCLLSDRDARFQSARALLGALEAAVVASDGQPAAPATSGLAPPAMGLGATGPLPGQIPQTMGQVAQGGGPAVSQPGYSQPGVSQPGYSHPGASHPGVSHPGVSQPGYSHPEASHPGASHPGASHPGASHPGAYGSAGQAALQGTAMLPAGAAPAAPPSTSSGGRLGLVLLVVALFLLGAGVVGGAFLFVLDDGEAGEAVADRGGVQGIPSPTALPDPPADEAPSAEATEPPGDPEAEEPGAGSSAVASPEPASAERPSERPSPEPAPSEPADTPRSDRPPRPSPSDRASRPAPTPEPAPEPAPTPRPAAPPRPRPPPRGLTQQQIAQTVNGRTEYLNRRCYQRRVRRVRDLAGVVTLAWTVAANGRVENAQVVHNGTGDEWLARCTRNVIRDLRFPQASNGASTPVRYPFQFRQGG